MRKYLNDEKDASQQVVAKEVPKANLGFYRTLIAIATVGATVVVLLWVAVTAGTYNNTVAGARKAIVIVVDGLSPDVVDFAAKSNKAPFISELVAHGAVMGSLAIPSDVRDAMAAQQTILTGMTPTQTGVYSSNDFNKALNTTSFLKLGRSSEMRIATIAPSKMYSSGQFTDGKCDDLGILDAECVGLACPTNNDTDSFCNAAWRIKTAEDTDENTRNEEYIFSQIAAAASAKMDLVFVDLTNYASSGAQLGVNHIGSLSEMYVTDSLVGRIASLLAARSGEKSENWLMFITSDGQNTEKLAPYVIANLKEGAPAAVTQPSEAASLLDVFPTIVQWLGLSPRAPAGYKGRILGVCPKNNVSIVEGC